MNLQVGPKPYTLIESLQTPFKGIYRGTPDGLSAIEIPASLWLATAGQITASQVGGAYTRLYGMHGSSSEGWFSCTLPLWN